MNAIVMARGHIKLSWYAVVVFTFLSAVLFLNCKSEGPELKTPGKRAHHELIFDVARNKILIAGGSTPLHGGQSFTFYNDLWESSGSGWQFVGTSGQEMSGMRMAYHTQLGKVFSLGGFSKSNTTLASFRRLDGGTWTELPQEPSLQGAEGGFVYDALRNRLVAFGGSRSRGVFNTATWEWNGTAWSEIPGAGPPGRQAFAMVYDTKRNRTVLFGGMGTTRSQLFGDTWEYDGQWTKVADTGPGQRVAMGYCFDSQRGLLIIFGGADAAGTKGDTWGWNGTTWQLLSSSGPPSREMGYMAYDPSQDRVVMFGGRLGWPNDTDDTWTWDGAQWRESKTP